MASLRESGHELNELDELVPPVICLAEPKPQRGERFTLDWRKQGVSANEGE
jgi:hypothetical protein